MTSKGANMNAPAGDLPLAGLKVLDISTYIAAPAAAVVLSDFGADVIKVEQPGEGDPNRQIYTHAGYPKQPSWPDKQVNYPWNMDARNKRSLAIDVKAEAGRAALYKLIAQADILIINFPHPVRARLKLAYDDVAHLNPRLIYASLTGYGEAGPDRDAPGFEFDRLFRAFRPARSASLRGTSAAFRAACARRSRDGHGASVGHHDGALQS